MLTLKGKGRNTAYYLYYLCVLTRVLTRPGFVIPFIGCLVVVVFLAYGHRMCL